MHLNLTVTNNVISHNVKCSFTPTYDNGFKLPSPLRCTGGKFNEITLDVTWSGSAPNFNVKIEQLWYCLENPATNVNPTEIIATGNVGLQLTCESHTGITGSPDDIVTICTDPAKSHSVDGTQAAKQTLPPYSLITAWPTQGGCTFDSVVSPTFYYRGMYFSTSWTDASKDDVTILSFTAGLNGPGFGPFWFYEGSGGFNNKISGSGVNAV